MHTHTHTRAHTHVQHIDEAALCPGPKRVHWNTEYITSIHSSRTRQIKHRKYSSHQIHLDKQTLQAPLLSGPGTGPAEQQMVRWCQSGRALAGQTPTTSPVPRPQAHHIHTSFTATWVPLSTIYSDNSHASTMTHL